MGGGRGVPWSLAGAVLSARRSLHGRVFTSGSGGARRGSRVAGWMGRLKSGSEGGGYEAVAMAGDRGDASGGEASRATVA